MLPNFELKADIRYEKVYTTVDWRQKDIDGKVKTFSVHFQNNAVRLVTVRVSPSPLDVNNDIFRLKIKKLYLI